MVTFRLTRDYRVWIVMGLLLAGCNQSQSVPPFDLDLEGLEQVRLVTGDEAINAINRLHGMPIDVVRGFIAYYEGLHLHDKATIWLSETTSEDLAQRQIEVMIDRMKNSTRSPFSHYRVLDANGASVIGFDGMGQVHYVFRDNKWVYWISADASRIDKILDHVMKRT
ncbi:MAG: hypothetical protein JW883_07275 [Deltaproteobacteria bacterium]|nr:hypothetical protein [Deltaproteobacteria bacterium]